MAPGQRRSNVRRANVTACMRCKSRKQRCDQNLPACSNCQSADADCVSVDIDGRETPRSYLKSLQDRVAYLEKQLIEHGITEYDSTSPGTPSALPSSARTVPLANNAGNASEVLPILLGPLQHLGSTDVPEDGLERNFELLRKLPYETHIDLPSSDAARTLTDAYFEHSEFFSPTVSPRSFDPVLETVQQGRQSFEGAPVQSRFRALLIFAIAVCLMNRMDASFPISRSEAYYASEIRLLSLHADLVQREHMECLKNLMFVVQYNFSSSNLTAAWFLVGFATRMIIEIDLQNEPGEALGLDPNVKNQHHWIFWTVYSFERILCSVTNRPCSIPDEAINVSLPAIDDTNFRRPAALHMIKHRMLLSEIHRIVSQEPPVNGACLDYSVWREGMQHRLQEWHRTVLELDASTKLAPAESFHGMYYNAVSTNARSPMARQQHLS